MPPEILRLVLGVSSVLGLLAFLAYLYYLLQIRGAERSVRGIIGGDRPNLSREVVRILEQFKDDVARFEALKVVTHYESAEAERLLDKIKSNIDISRLASSNLQSRIRLALTTAVLFVLIAVASLIYYAMGPRPTSSADTTIGAMTAPKPRSTSQMLEGELPPDNHFQLDAAKGVFCENTNVRDDFAPYFDYVEIGLQDCSPTTESRSRSYRVIWPSEGPQSVSPESRRNYRQCFVSDLARRAPKLVEDLQGAFQRIRSRVPCRATISVWRIISLSYTDLRDQSRQVAFAQSYNQGRNGSLDIRQVPTTSRATPSSVPGEINFAVDPPTLDSEILEIVRQYGFPNIP